MKLAPIELQDQLVWQADDGSWEITQWKNDRGDLICRMQGRVMLHNETVDFLDVLAEEHGITLEGTWVPPTLH